jgi:hypothetical protein
VKNINIFNKILLKAVCCIVLVLLSSLSYAADYYVRKGATGSNNGTNWINAWNEMDQIVWASISAGDTIWLAGGTYNKHLSVTASGTSDNRIYIKRARAMDSECSSANGWSAGYDAQVVLNAKGISFGTSNKGSYVTIDGRISKGIRLDFTGATAFSAIANVGASTNVTLRYIEIEGAGTGATQTGDCRGINWTAVASSDYLTVEYCDIHGMDSNIYTRNSNHTIQYSNLYDSGCANSPTYHPNTYYIVCPASNITFRYNTVWNNSAEGVFPDMGICNNILIYGNVFHDGGFSVDDDGDDAHTNRMIYNNTFSNMHYAPRFRKAGQTGEYKNNIEYNCTAGLYVISGATVARATNWVGSSDPGFQNLIGYNFRLKSSATSLINQGTDLSSIFTSDKVGNTFGADGYWDIGAYEYNVMNIGAPQNFRKLQQN